MPDPPDAARDEPGDLLLRARRRAESAAGRGREAREEAQRARLAGNTRLADRYEREAELHDRAAALHVEAARLQAQHVTDAELAHIERAAAALRRPEQASRDG
jgi:hypothetical protein